MCLLQPIFETVEEVSGLVIGGMLSSFWLFEQNGGDSTAGSSGPFLSVRQRLQFATSFVLFCFYFFNSKNSRLSNPSPFPPLVTRSNSRISAPLPNAMFLSV